MDEQRTVERFEPYVDYSVEDNGEPDMRPAKDGDWRRNEDYERLEREKDDMSLGYYAVVRNSQIEIGQKQAQIAKLQDENKALREALQSAKWCINGLKVFGNDNIHKHDVPVVLAKIDAALAAHGSET